MKIINNGILRILYPENGYELINKETGNHSDKVYLGINDSIDNYIEIMKDGYYENMESLKSELDDENILLMNTLDSLITLLEPVIMAMPMTLDGYEDEEVKSPIDIIVLFYAKMIEKGLKDVNEIPSIFKTLIINKDL